VENETQKDDATGHRADIGQAELARAVISQHETNRALHWPDWMQDIKISIGDNVCRHSQWQQKRPFQHTPPPKIVSRHQPCRRCSKKSRYDPYPSEQNHRFEKSAWQVGG